ncbi:hypothetical protein ACQKWADRAFT_286119 [Trichoderma austrokoningii]
MLPFAILMAVVSAFISCIVVVVKLTRKSALMMKTRPQETVTQSLTALATSPLTLTSLLNVTNGTLSLTASISGPSAITTTATAAPLSPSPSTILSSSNLASVFFDGESSEDSLEILIWQDEAGYLSYLNGDSNIRSPIRIEALLVDAPKAKKGTSMVAVADDSSTAHLFYLEENNTISHIYMEPKGSWSRGGMSTGSNKSLTAHEKSMLSAAFHYGEHDTNVVVLSYQDPRGNLQLAMSEDPKKDDDWYLVDFGSFTGRRKIGDWGGAGHAIAGDWQNKKHDSDGSFSGLLMAVEESEEITPWECSVDFHESSKKKIECHFLDKTFLDSNGKGISLSSHLIQLTWVRTGHGKSQDPAQTLPYEFALLYKSPGGSIQENRVGIDLPRIVGPGFNVDMDFDSFVTNDNKTVYAKSGSDIVVFRLDADGWQWSVDGIVDTGTSGNMATLTM